ncbi:MAG: hypothetical protein IPK76_26435 [Lewinellaceae bacterium]|nr:hypothetical protein [Lewinellaceae bacterium]
MRSKIPQSKPAMQVYFVEKGALHIGDIPENEKVKGAGGFGFFFFPKTIGSVKKERK